MDALKYSIENTGLPTLIAELRLDSGIQLVLVIGGKYGLIN